MSFKVGDRVIYSRGNVVTVLKIQGNYALVEFEAGAKICTTIHGLKKNDPKADLTVSTSGTVDANVQLKLL